MTNQEKQILINQLIEAVDSHTPWLWEGSIWKSEAQYWSWLRGQLRNIWGRKWPFKNKYINEHTFQAPEYDESGNSIYIKSGKNAGKPKTRKHFTCEVTGETLPASVGGKNSYEIDHKSPAGKCNNGLEACIFLFRLLTHPDNMRIISKDVHKVITYAERMGIAYEEAVIEKKVIEAMKQKASIQLEQLKKEGFKESEISNSKGRKECYRKLFTK